ncbi:CDP-alcohol phosphatidyltransferase family protein [Rhodoferax antarcticus]|uniref:CDP-alcohol phosphatidyltransferase family protein n=1 Tax=Rhodoferax antarcticus TaxID=81479 RepID=UPI0022254019|nr:CDP-alcohol phosphatidyltransferase family protein [Rhodoferax antarcticus]MCW2314266.1 phosphatidylglycerophosphate synthase [Rhodoferax antarcticus]
MFDRALNAALQRPLKSMASALVRSGWRADQVTWLGFALGLLAVPLIGLGHAEWALLAMALNRLADGLDGAIARLTQPTDRGAFLDISLDFLFYASIPLAFALADPANNALAAAVLIYSFIGTAGTFLAFAVLAAKRGLSSTAFAGKGFYYLGGLTESFETLLVFTLMCLWPTWFAALAYGFAALCALTTVTRIVAGIRTFKPD